MAVIHIDGKSYEVDGADNLLAACLSLGIDVPYFCYHPALGSVGSCRQCAVKQFNNEEDYKAGRGRLVMSCMVAPTNDMYISVDDDEAKTFRKRIVEYIMTNHPHDCPTCEEGGHCHLQDMTYMSGHRVRRYRFAKRTHHNQDLGAFINHEMNRCIACYRCVRFYKDYAGGTDFGVYASNNRVYFGREVDGQLQSEFSGNLTEVCPTGVFTDKTHSDRYNRKWDMQYAPSICHGCSVGCAISAGERYGELRRIENRYNPDVNGYFLCDKGRFGYGYVNRADRPMQPLEKVDGKSIKINADFALDGVVSLLKNKKIIGIGSASASLESNFALKKLVGDTRYSTGESAHTKKLVCESVRLLRHEHVNNVSVGQIQTADCVLILGEDLTQTASRAALAVRQAAKNNARKMASALRTEHWLAEPVQRIGQDTYSPIYSVHVTDTKLSDIAKVPVVASIEDIAKLGFMIGKIVHSFSDDIAQITQSVQAVLETDSDAYDDERAMELLAYRIAYDLIMAERPLVVSGTSLLSAAIVHATGYICQAVSQKRSQIIKAQTEATNDNPTISSTYVAQTGVYLVLPEANSVGLNLLGGKAIEEVLALDFDAVVVVENSLAHISQAFLEKIISKPVVVIDSQSYDWHEQTHFVLSAGAFCESDGTLISAEGRAGRFFAAYDKKYYLPNSELKDSWRWLGAIMRELDPKQYDNTWAHLDDVLHALVAEYPALTAILDAAPSSNYRITGLKIAREPRRYSGRTAMRAKISVHEPMQPKDTDTALTFSMEGYVGEQTPAPAIAFAWSAGWNSPQAWNKLQETVGGVLKGGDVGVRVLDTLPKLHHVYEFMALGKVADSSLVDGRAKLVPVFALFSSSALIASSPVVGAQIAPAVWTIGEEDAAAWGVQAGELLQISQNDNVFVLPIQTVPYIADGCIGYPFGQVSLLPYLPASVKKVASDTPVFVPLYQKRLHAIEGKYAPSLSLTNTNGRVQTFNNAHAQTVTVGV